MRRSFRFPARLICGLALALFAPAASAAIYCVTNVSDLQSALNAAAASFNDDEIKLKQGIYAVQQRLFYNSPNNGWLFISGGWIQDGENNCAQQVPAAANTVLTGSAMFPVLGLYFNPSTTPSAGPRYGLYNLSIRDGYGDSATFQRGGGVQMTALADVQTELFLDNVIIANNIGFFGGGADLYVRRGLIRIVNSLFANNSSPTTAYGHFAATSVSGNNPYGVLIANSSFVNGQCPGSGGRGCGIGVIVGGGQRLDIINSLFSGNAFSDVNIEGAASGGFGNGTAFADHSLIGALSGTLPLSASNALVGDPRFVDVPGQDFRLRDDSPFINRGLGTVPVYGYPPADLAGNLRLRFGALDPGAYENQTWDFIFADGFQ